MGSQFEPKTLISLLNRQLATPAVQQVQRNKIIKLINDNNFINVNFNKPEESSKEYFFEAFAKYTDEKNHSKYAIFHDINSKFDDKSFALMFFSGTVLHYLTSLSSVKQDELDSEKVTPYAVDFIESLCLFFARFDKESEVKANVEFKLKQDFFKEHIIAYYNDKSQVKKSFARLICYDVFQDALVDAITNFQANKPNQRDYFMAKLAFELPANDDKNLQDLHRAVLMFGKRVKNNTSLSNDTIAQKCQKFYINNSHKLSRFVQTRESVARTDHNDNVRRALSANHSSDSERSSDIPKLQNETNALFPSFFTHPVSKLKLIFTGNVKDFNSNELAEKFLTHAIQKTPESRNFRRKFFMQWKLFGHKQSYAQQIQLEQLSGESLQKLYAADPDFSQMIHANKDAYKILVQQDIKDLTGISNTDDYKKDFINAFSLNTKSILINNNEHKLLRVLSYLAANNNFDPKNDNSTLLLFSLFNPNNNILSTLHKAQPEKTYQFLNAISQYLTAAHKNSDVAKELKQIDFKYNKIFGDKQSSTLAESIFSDMTKKNKPQENQQQKDVSNNQSNFDF